MPAHPYRHWFSVRDLGASNACLDDETSLVMLTECRKNPEHRISQSYLAIGSCAAFSEISFEGNVQNLDEGVFVVVCEQCLGPRHELKDVLLRGGGIHCFEPSGEGADF